MNPKPGVRNRTQLLQEIIASGALAAAPPAPPATLPEAPNPADAKVSAALDGVKAAIKTALEAQAEDPDNGTNPADQAVLAGLQQLAADLEAILNSQQQDVASDADGATPPPDGDQGGTPPADAPVRAAGADERTTSAAVDENGNVDEGAECQTPDCHHLGSSHGDSDLGERTGACTEAGCKCLAMKTAADQLGDSESDDGVPGGPNNGVDGGSEISGDHASAMRGALAVDPSEGSGSAPDAATAAPKDSNPPPEMTGGSEPMGPAFTIPVGIIEGQETGDGRQIEIGALDWRIPPLPLMGLKTNPHGGMFDPNDPAVWCGRIDSLERVPGENGTQIIMARGFYFNNEDGLYFADLTGQMGRAGISADVAVDEDVMIESLGPNGEPMISSKLTRGTIMAFTQCPMPAFEGAYIVLGDGAVQPEPIPMEGESAISASSYVKGQQIHFMSYKECIPCASGSLDVITAAGGPLAPPKAWFENPGFQVGDGRLMEIYERRGDRALGGRFACFPTVTEDGRYFGHIAPFGVCHSGIKGECVVAPRSKQGYAQFLRGQKLITAEGEEVSVGIITLGTGHADQRASAGAAMGHYDNTGFQVAHVAVGEDEFGIWFSGALMPSVTEEQKRILRATPLSGDWRPFGGSLELVAALAVNQPGFTMAPVSLAASGDERQGAIATIEQGTVISLVSAGFLEMSSLTDSLLASGADEEPIPGAPAWAERALLRLGHQDALSRLAPLRVGN